MLILHGRTWNVRSNINQTSYESLTFNLILKEGHKYLFSDLTHNWGDAVTKCQSYGGWLLNIKSLEEQNCLVRYANTHGLSAWYWTDGMF